MEYIPGLTIKESTYNTTTMKDIYERVQAADKAMIAAGIHHNDLHGGNVMIVERPKMCREVLVIDGIHINEKSLLPDSERCEKSPLPEIVILDFGEASFGPRRPMYK
jgi:predicted unusual protein kinase regulating ubiquinone biosynthesis (AarF/ABC1/UbiB family)